MIFAGSSGKNFAQRMCRFMGARLGLSEVKRFSEGNIMVRIGETVRDKDVYLLQPIGLHPNDEFVEILFWLDAFKRASASSVTAIIPYFGYAKGDKKDEPRVSIRARVCAESIELAGADRVVTMDLHSPQVQGFFKKPTDHIYAMPVLCNYIKRMNIQNLTVVSPDAGYAKMMRKYANYFHAPVAIGDKTRYDHDEKAEVLDLVGNVEGRNCLVVDDFTISGGTLANLAELLKNRGALDIYACLSHNIVTPSGVKRLEESPIKQIISTDTVENSYVLGHERFITISVAPLFAETVLRIHNRMSVSPLFEQVPEEVSRSSVEQLSLLGGLSADAMP